MLPKDFGRSDCGWRLQTTQSHRYRQRRQRLVHEHQHQEQPEAWQVSVWHLAPLANTATRCDPLPAVNAERSLAVGLQEPLAWGWCWTPSG